MISFALDGAIDYNLFLVAYQPQYRLKNHNFDFHSDDHLSREVNQTYATVGTTGADAVNQHHFAAFPEINCWSPFELVAFFFSFYFWFSGQISGQVDLDAANSSRSLLLLLGDLVGYDIKHAD